MTKGETLYRESPPFMANGVQAIAPWSRSILPPWHQRVGDRVLTYDAEMVGCQCRAMLAKGERCSHLVFLDAPGAVVLSRSETVLMVHWLAWNPRN